MLVPSLRFSLGCFQSKIWFPAEIARQELSRGTQVRTCWACRGAGCFADKPVMLPIELRIDRAQRLLRMIEQDAPLLAARVAPLSRERQESVKSYARSLAALTRAEISRLLEENVSTEVGEFAPQAAD